MKCYLYAGPSLGKTEDFVDNNKEMVLLPPIKRGDLIDLIENYEPESVIIADGIFHNHPPVGHQEIRRALERNWKIFGVSSMGAIRAFEMQDFGIIGYGEVYEWFKENPDFTDDEVTLTHFPIPPYTHISEPLINIRFLLNTKVEEKIFNKTEVSYFIEELKKLYFGERTISRLYEIVHEKCGDRFSQAEMKQHLHLSDNNRIKSIDLRNLLIEKPWLQ